MEGFRKGVTGSNYLFRLRIQIKEGRESLTNMGKKFNLREIMKTEKSIIVPELYDCSSAKAAELNGFHVIMLSSGDLACSLTGIPDLQLLSLDEVVGVTDRICNFSPLPLLIDADEGFGRPLNTYYACKRLVKAGASGVLITDAAALGKNGVLPVREAVHRFQAAHDGLEGSDAILIARCDVNPETNFEEAVERCNKYIEAGADVTLILWMHKVKGNKTEMCRRLASRIPGPKWYPDLSTEHGVPEVNLDEIASLGYQFVGVHYAMHAAMIAMLDSGRHVFQSKDNVYVNEHYEDTGYRLFSPMSVYLKDRFWADLESKYVDDPEDSLAVRTQEYFYRDDDKY